MKNWQEDVIAVVVISGAALGYFVQASFVPMPQKPIIYPSSPLVVYEPITVTPISAGGGAGIGNAGGGSCGQ